MSAYDPIQTTQEALGLKGRDELFAELLDVGIDQLRAAHDGDADALRNVVRAASSVLGLEPHEVARGDLEGRAGVVLLKTFVAPPYEEAFREIVAQGVHQELGRFVRALRRKAWLRRALGKEHPSLPPLLSALARPTPLANDRAPYGADDLARQVRERLSLGDRRIECVIDLVRDHLGIEVRTTRTLWPCIDGAAYALGPVRGILVNLREEPGPARIRMTLAHELCHVLFDGEAFGATKGSVLIFSPEPRDEATSRQRRRPRSIVDPPAVFRSREQRANAFAAYFLAPPSGVKALFGRHEPPMTLATVDNLAAYYGLSRLTAVNVLQNVYGWRNSDREAVLDLIDSAPAVPLEPRFAELMADTPDPDEETRALARDAVAAGRMFPSMHDRWLGIAAEREEPSAPAGDHPRGYWTSRAAAVAAEEILRFLGAHRLDPAVRVLWDSLGDWIEARDIKRSEDLMRLLPPDQVGKDVIVHLLSVVANVPELAAQRAEYARHARESLARLGESTASIDAMLGRFTQ